MTNFKEKLAKARLPQSTIDVCLNGDLVAEFELLEKQLEAIEGKQVDSLAGNGSAEIIERLDALREQMQESVETFTLRAQPHRRTPGDDRPTWNELVQRHPPRRDDNGEIIAADKTNPPFNTSTYYDDLIRVCTVSPELDDADWDALLSSISEGQFDQLALAAQLLNRGGVDIPFSRAASRMKRASAAE